MSPNKHLKVRQFRQERGFIVAELDCDIHANRIGEEEVSEDSTYPLRDWWFGNCIGDLTTCMFNDLHRLSLPPRPFHPHGKPR